MLNAAGEVVGVNAFGDFATNGGPGISGAIAVARLRPLLDSVPRASAALNDNFDRILPTAPAASYPVALLQQIADTAPTKHYARLLDRNANKFLISITTPVTAFVSIKASESDVAGDRRKREARAGVASDQKYSELAQHRDWAQYVGSPTTAVVTVTIQPKIAETFWSALGRGLEAYSYGGSISQAKMKFAGDVRGARFYRNGIEVEPIRGGHGPQAFRIDNRWVQLKDVADMGYYVLPIEAFMPDSLGRPPIVSIVISDLKNPSTLSAADILDGDAARVWNDFVPYFQSVRPSAGARFVDTRLRSERIPLICDAVAAACVRQ